MKRIRAVLLALLVPLGALSGLVFLTAAPSEPAGAIPAPPAPRALGFVDVQRVIFEYKKTREITLSLEKKLGAHLERVRQQAAALQEKKESLELFPEDDLKTLEQVKRIRLEEVDLEIQRKNVRVRLELEIVGHMKKVYKEILREVEAVARQRGLSAVFMVTTEEIEGRSKAELSSNILVRPVLWFDPRLDLTTELIQRLNR